MGGEGKGGGVDWEEGSWRSKDDDWLRRGKGARVVTVIQTKSNTTHSEAQTDKNRLALGLG